MDLIPQVSSLANFPFDLLTSDVNGSKDRIDTLEDDKERRRQDRGRERRKETRWNTDKTDQGGLRSRSRSKDRDRDRKRDRDSELADRDKERRGKDRPREKDRERDRDRDRDDLRERDDYLYRRERDRERERDRDRRDRERRRRSDDRFDREVNVDDRTTARPRDRQRDYTDDDYDYKRDKVSVPTQLIMLRNLPFSVIDEDIAAEIQTKGLNYKEIRIIKDRNGESKGIGFVEFHDATVAERWTYLTQGIIHLGDRSVQLEYSRPKPLPKPAGDQDWACTKCGTLNYASRKRTTCFSCGAQREDTVVETYEYDHESAPDDGHFDRDYRDRESREQPMVAPPCNVLILRGLDFQTSEETIRNSIVLLTSTPIYDVRLIKDKVTGMSRGFCFVEMGSTQDATDLMEHIQKSEPPYSIEGKRVLVGYAKNSHNPPVGKPRERNEPKPKPAVTVPSTKSKSSNIASVAIAQAQAAQLQGEYNLQYDEKQSQDPTQQYAQGVPASQQATGLSQSQAYYTATQSQADSTQTYSQTTQQQYTPGQYSQYTPEQLQQYYLSQTASQQTPAQLQTYQNTAPQPTSTYVYDSNTGYYYDSSTGLYYDANTGYYYNGNTGQFLYWDAQQQQYLVVNQDGSVSLPAATTSTTASTVVVTVATVATAAESTAEPATVGAEADVGAVKDNKVKVEAKPTSFNAKKIAKDMQRWARQTNKANTAKKDAVRIAQIEQQQREVQEEALRRQIQEETGAFKKPSQPVTVPMKEQKKPQPLAKSLFTPDVEDESPLATFAVIPKDTSSKPPRKSLVAEYGIDEDSDDDDKVDDKFADYTLMACLLCKRRFPNKDGLVKHQQLSDLHKQNLELYKRKLKSEMQEISAQMKGHGR